MAKRYFGSLKRKIFYSIGLEGGLLFVFDCLHMVFSSLWMETYNLEMWVKRIVLALELLS